MVVAYVSKNIKIILDTDTANEADDYFALIYLLKNKDLFDIETITIALFRMDIDQDDVSNSIDDTCKIFDYLNIDDKSMMYKGSRNYISKGYDE